MRGCCADADVLHDGLQGQAMDRPQQNSRDSKKVCALHIGSPQQQLALKCSANAGGPRRRLAAQLRVKRRRPLGRRCPLNPCCRCHALPFVQMCRHLDMPSGTNARVRVPGNMATARACALLLGCCLSPKTASTAACLVLPLAVCACLSIC
jgi:hypothetical protein